MVLIPFFLHFPERNSLEHEYFPDLNRFESQYKNCQKSNPTKPDLMKTIGCFFANTLALILFSVLSPIQAESLKLHAIFDSDMVLQRGKPIVIWGWAEPGASVSVQFGTEKTEAKAAGEKGRWDVTFPAREASAIPQILSVNSGSEKIEMGNIVIGDVWVMYGQSNMAFPLKQVTNRDTESAQANLPHLRLFSIATNEQADLVDDIERSAIETKGWVASTPEAALEFSAIGFVFGKQLQLSTGIPIGVIKNSRGGASMESLVPIQKFQQNSSGKALVDAINAQRASFDLQAESLKTYEKELKQAKDKKRPEDQWPKKPINGENVRSWNIPGKSPSHPASVYNGMFGVFKGYNIKGVLLHHGYNNAMTSNCRPKFYRWMTKALIDGVREDFRDPTIAYGVIGFCAGGRPQNEEDFEWQPPGPAYIREAQRLGVEDLKDPLINGYIPAYDVQVPGLHPSKKVEHGQRAARWVLNKFYDKNVQWDEAKLLSVKAEDDEMILTFDRRAHPDDMSPIIEGFALAGEDGRYYKAYARNSTVGDFWTAAKIIHVWSPLVPKPIHVRYAWGHSPMGNLKVNGHQEMPIPEFRTDSWDLPESEDLTDKGLTREFGKQWNDNGKTRLEFRRIEEAKRAPEIVERLKNLGKAKP
jgi:sialate O-acetylesterase